MFSLWSSYMFPMFLLWFSYGFLMVSLWLCIVSYAFPIVFLQLFKKYCLTIHKNQLINGVCVFPMVSDVFPMVILHVSYVFAMVFLWSSYMFPIVSLWFSYGFLMAFHCFLCFPHCFPMVILQVSYGFLIASMLGMLL